MSIIRPDQLNIDDQGNLLVKSVGGSSQTFDGNGNLKVSVPAAAYDPDGSQKVSTTGGIFPAVAADLVSLNAVLNVDVSDAANISFHLKNTGSAAMAAGSFLFEASLDSTDGVNGTWVGMQALRSNGNATETGFAVTALAAAAGNPYAWKVSVVGFNWFRIRTTVAVTASSSARWTVLRGAYPTEPTPAVQTHPVTGSGNFNMAPIGGTNHLLVTAATTNISSIKASPGQMYELTVFNPTAATIYVKLYNKSTAPVLATDTPIYTLPVPAGGEVSRIFGVLGKRFASGIGIAVTGAAAPTDATAVAVGAVISDTWA